MTTARAGQVLEQDLLACLLRVNVLDDATRLAGPDSASVAYPNDDTLYSTAFLDLRAGSQPGTFRPMDPISSETIRHAATDERGETTLHAREYATLDRAGRVQLPREMTRRLGMRNRVELQEEPDHIGVWPDQAADQERP
jgi:hypothetical protein